MPSVKGALVQISDEMEGLFIVATDDGTTYQLDLHHRFVIASSAAAAAAADPATRVVVDAAPAKLLTVATCRLGVPMVLLIDRGIPGVWFTRRATANVRHIDAVDASLRTPPRRITR
ncbi:hypothetical protein [Microbacterium sp. R86528]|uniref:hypothetical protein n=1 Tax=Microbacterium sp. R86528 TaxID=3093864 RepID=UPI0037CB00C6